MTVHVAAVANATTFAVLRGGGLPRRWCAALSKQAKESTASQNTPLRSEGDEAGGTRCEHDELLNSRALPPTSWWELEKKCAASNSAVIVDASWIHSPSLLPNVGVHALPQELAELREHEIATQEHRLQRAVAEAEVRAEAKGHAEGVRLSLKELCTAQGIALDDDRRKRIEAASLEELGELFRTIASTGQWPE